MGMGTWTVERAGTGRRAAVLRAARDGLAFSRGDVLVCGESVGLVIAFRLGDSSAAHQVQLLLCRHDERGDALLATPSARWYAFDDITESLGPVPIARATDGESSVDIDLSGISASAVLQTVRRALESQSPRSSALGSPEVTPKRARRSAQRSAGGADTSVLPTPLADTTFTLAPADLGTSDESEPEFEDEPLPARKKKQESGVRIEKLADALEASQIQDKSPQKRRGKPLASPRKRVSPRKKSAISAGGAADDRVELFPVTDVAEGDAASLVFGETRSSSDSEDEASPVLGARKTDRSSPKTLPVLDSVSRERDALDRVLAQLHPASEPDMHPCREEQFDLLFNALESAIAAETGTCIYVSGTPGTGKTSTIREVIGQLDLRVHEGELKPFQFLEINGMKLVHPNAAYERLWSLVGRRAIAQSNAMTALESIFSRDDSVEDRGTIVVLLDEMDQLITKGQQLMYNFFNWPSLQHSRLIVIAVANTMDLPERVLSNKISSRVGLTRIQFPGYSHEQLKTIVNQRLDETGGAAFVGDNAVDYATRKVAGVGGDARRVLEFIRAGILIALKEQREAEEGLGATGSAHDDCADSDNKSQESNDREYGKSRPFVKIAHVREATQLAQQAPLANFVQTLSLSTKLFLCALLSRTRRTANIEVPVHDVLRQASQFAKSASQSDVFMHNLFSQSRVSRAGRLAMFQHAILELIDGGIIVSQAIKGEATPNVRLMASAAAIKELLEPDPLLKGMV